MKHFLSHLVRFFFPPALDETDDRETLSWREIVPILVLLVVAILALIAVDE